MNGDNAELKASWKERQETLGSTKRSVLYKNFPDFLNSYVHARHMRFILSQMPESPKHILDLGCGYGRISAEVKKAHPGSIIQGVELCDEFAEQFRKDIGECASGSIQSYEPSRQFDVILFVTVLMYLTADELAENLNKYWGALSPGGRLICIEPFNNVLTRLRKASDNKAMSPTGGDHVHYFQAGELKSRLASLPHSVVVSQDNFGILPVLNFPRLHEGFSVEKETV
jgi:trans-aconitate methyltransferase